MKEKKQEKQKLGEVFSSLKDRTKMKKIINVAILGSTGFVGLEIIKILNKHPNVKINFLGCESLSKKKQSKFKKKFSISKLPNLSLNQSFNFINSDVVFLALPHGVSNLYVKKFYDKIKIIDMSADFRLDSKEIYKKNYGNKHSCINLLNKFVYGLPEISSSFIKKSSNVAVPGCYPTSILLPLIPLIKDNLIKTNNIIIDSKSGYSGAGKKFDLNNINLLGNLNFYNYDTNNHRHICEIKQELSKHTNSKINFSFNPHLLPVFRGMMSTIYCDLKKGISKKDIRDALISNYKKCNFVNIVKDSFKADFYSIQNNNKCIIKLFDHHSDNKIIIVTLIDNLIKGASGQAIQNFNIMFNFDEHLSLINLK